MRKEQNELIHYWQYIHEYKRLYYADFNIDVKKLPVKRKSGKAHDKTYNDIICMIDTETSKSDKNGCDENGKTIPVYNYVVMWTCSIRAYGVNICTVWGRKPDELVSFLSDLQNKLRGDETYIYIHNMAYDWVFLRRFMIDEWAIPTRQINTKPHYPISITFENGITLKDSLILAQRSLDKWAKDMDVEHKKAVGYWDYTKIRTQDEDYTENELTYAEYDTLAGVECIDATLKALSKNISSIPLTATGIPRQEVVKRGKKHRAKEWFLKVSADFDLQQKLEQAYHGGYTHGNRHFIDTVFDRDLMCELYPDCEPVVKGADFSSSYPFTMLSEKFPSEKFTCIGQRDMEYIINNSDRYAFIAKVILINVHLKNDDVPMPPLQYSKCVKTVNAVQDNGRILCANYVEIYMTDPDICVINDYYVWDKCICTDVHASAKDYLPRWFTDFVYECYENKTKLKGGDKVQYSIAKAKANSLYGMTVQKPLKPELTENYDTGSYQETDINDEEHYTEYLDNNNKVLPYCIGVWVTSYAYRNLFELGKCFTEWLYSDTDSCYGIGLNMEMMNAYNEMCKKKLTDNGYGAVMHNGREYWLGIAEHDEKDDVYTEFKYMGAKRYIGRCISDGELHLTVAGVPKSGVSCLNDDIHNFKDQFIFNGSKTGKQTHYYLFTDSIKNDNGIIYADSIDLCPCDYKLSKVHVLDWEELFNEEIEVQVYGEE